MKLAALAAVASVVTALAALAAAPDEATDNTAEASAFVKVQLKQINERIGIVEQTDGSLAFELIHDDGRKELLDPDAFAARVHTEQAKRPWSMIVLNITSWLGAIWVGVGLLGQVLFSGRMLIQWLASERSRRSVVPTAFWWMSLGGASMLIIYFIWRRDIVGVLGQSTGWIIYTRNLYFIYGHHKPAPTIEDDPAPEPELSSS